MTCSASILRHRRESIVQSEDLLPSPHRSSAMIFHRPPGCNVPASGVTVSDAPTNIRAAPQDLARVEQWRSEATSWSFLLHLARVPYVVLILVGFGLLVPGQMRDMLAAIESPPEA